MAEGKGNPNQIGAMWKKDGDNGTYLTGLLEEDKLANFIGQFDGKVPIGLFPNTYKDKPKQPDFHVLVLKPKESRDSTPAPRAKKKKASFFDRD